MARRNKGRAVNGVVLLDKALGVSSNHALQQVRRTLDAQKAGHTGSLDPLATGLLPICLGEATKLSSYLLSADKRYRVTAAVGAETTTGDREGTFTEYADAAMPGEASLKKYLAGFVGTQTQVPPMYSALKVNGKPLYAYARAGESVAREPRPITVHDITLVSVEPDHFTLDVSVSGGTYVRTLVEDIARSWDGRAHVAALRRTGVGTLGRELPMVTQEQIADAAGEHLLAEPPSWLLPVSTLMADWPRADLAPEQAERLGQGQALAAADWPCAEPIRLDDAWGRVLGLGRRLDDGRLAPLRLFASPQA